MANIHVVTPSFSFSCFSFGKTCQLDHWSCLLLETLDHFVRLKTPLGITRHIATVLVTAPLHVSSRLFFEWVALLLTFWWISFYYSPSECGSVIPEEPKLGSLTAFYSQLGYWRLARIVGSSVEMRPLWLSPLNLFLTATSENVLTEYFTSEN